MTTTPGTRRGYDGTFTALVHPLSAADERHPGLGALRALIDSYPTPDPQTWLSAIALLHDLDALDRQHAQGELETAAYTQTLEDRHAAAPIASWMLATHLARLIHRLIRRRHAGQVAPEQSSRCLGEVTRDS